MEELRRSAKDLAFVNLFVPLLIMAMALFSLGTLAPIGIDGIKWHVFFMTMIQFVAYLPFFLLWFRFLDALKNSYQSNETIVTAVNLGKAAMIIRIIAIVIGVIASIAAVTSRSLFAGSVNMKFIGMCPNSRVEFVFEAFSLLSFVIIAVMYLLLSENTENKSGMKYITLALAALPIVAYITVSREEASFLWSIVQMAYYLIEFLFLYRIYKGFEFKS